MNFDRVRVGNVTTGSYDLVLRNFQKVLSFDIEAGSIYINFTTSEDRQNLFCKALICNPYETHLPNMSHNFSEKNDKLIFVNTIQQVSLSINLNPSINRYYDTYRYYGLSQYSDGNRDNLITIPVIDNHVQVPVPSVPVSPTDYALHTFPYNCFLVVPKYHDASKLSEPSPQTLLF